MPSLEQTAFNKNAYETGIRWHEPSRRFIAEIGYHEVVTTAADGTVATRRVRTVHYLGRNHEHVKYMSQFRSIKADWNGTIMMLRREYDATQERRRVAGLSPLPRFKPVWPNRIVRNARRSTVGQGLLHLAQTHPNTTAVSAPEKCEHSAPQHDDQAGLRVAR